MRNEPIKWTADSHNRKTLSCTVELQLLCVWASELPAAVRASELDCHSHRVLSGFAVGRWSLVKLRITQGVLKK